MRPVSSIHIMRTRVSFMVILICCLLSASATAQEASSTKFDAFNDLPTDDTQAHLDLFAQELRKDETLQGLQLMTEFGEKSVCTTLTLWVVPPTFSKPRGTTAEKFLLTRLMAEAEKNRYAIRRLEFVGSTWTRDSALRKQTQELREGEIFSYTRLRHSLNNLSRVRSIYPVRIGDVDAYLNPDESTLDITIHVRPRFRERR